MSGVFIKRGEFGHTGRYKQRGNEVETQGEDQLYKRGYYPSAGAGAWTDSPSQLSGGTNCAHSLTSDFQPSELGDNTCRFFKPTDSQSSGRAAPGNDNLYLMYKIVVSISGVNVCKYMWRMVAVS